MKKIIRSKSEILKTFNDQIRLLKKRCIDFDNGDEYEARQISTILRNLFHTKGRTKSIINQIGLDESYFLLSFVSPYNPANLMPYIGLLGIKVIGNEGMKYNPIIYDSEHNEKIIEFHDWWNEIIFDDNKYFFSRRDIILNVAETDGGSHVDDSLNENYHSLSINNSIGWKFEMNGKSYNPQNNPAMQALRVIAQEVIESVKIVKMIINSTKSERILKGNDMVKSYNINERLFFIHSATKVFETNPLLKIQNWGNRFDSGYLVDRNIYKYKIETIRNINTFTAITRY